MAGLVGAAGGGGRRRGDPEGRPRAAKVRLRASAEDAKILRPAAVVPMKSQSSQYSVWNSLSHTGLGSRLRTRTQNLPISTHTSRQLTATPRPEL